jgi:uncharacterized protein (TIGR03000 family)
MYSVVLATALMAGGEAPAWGGGYGGCTGGHVGIGGALVNYLALNYSCGGGGNYFAFSGCYGNGIGGCFGGAHGGGYGACYGAAGSCYGGATGACYGSASGGSCYGATFYGSCSGCYGGGFSGYYGSMFGCNGNCYGGALFFPATSAIIPTPALPGVAVVPVTVTSQNHEHHAAPAAAPARFTVRLPAEAKLFVEGQASTLTSDTRTFETPALRPDRNYAYALKAEMIRDGKVVVESREVIFQAGKDVTVDFSNLGQDRSAQR